MRWNEAPGGSEWSIYSTGKRAAGLQVDFRVTILINKRPSEYFHDQMYATFFNDAVGGHSLSWWGEDNCMWSNDFPHANSTWPDSRKYIERDLGHLPPEKRTKLLSGNVARLYGMEIPQPLQVAQQSATM